MGFVEELVHIVIALLPKNFGTYAETLAEVRGDCIHEIEKLCEKTTSRNHTYTGFNLLSREAENVFT